MSEIIKDQKTGAFVEQDCTIELNGHKLTSGGSWLCQRKDTGKFEGILYARVDKRQMVSWDGTLQIPAHFSEIQWHNFSGRRNLQHVWFSYNGMNFYGKYCPNYKQAVHVRQVK